MKELFFYQIDKQQNCNSVITRYVSAGLNLWYLQYNTMFNTTTNKLQCRSCRWPVGGLNNCQLPSALDKEHFNLTTRATVQVVDVVCISLIENIGLTSRRGIIGM